MTYPRNVPPARDEKGSSLVLGVLALFLFGGGCITFVRSESPSGGFLGGVLVTLAFGAAFLAGWEPR